MLLLFVLLLGNPAELRAALNPDQKQIPVIYKNFMKIVTTYFHYLKYSRKSFRVRRFGEVITRREKKCSQPR